MKVTIVNEGGKVTAKIEGEIDTINAAQFEASLQPLYDSLITTIVVDCTGLTYISSAGLRVFLIIHKHATSAKKQLILNNITPEIYGIFKMTGFVSIFTIE